MSSDETPANCQGNFFQVDRRAVEDATRYGDGINTAVAYLALARYTDRSNRATRAGMTAIHARTGMSRGRADLAIKTLERAGLVRAPERRGSRSIHPWSFVRWVRADLSDRQWAVVVHRILDKKNPITSSADRDYQVAYALAQKELLEKVDEAKPGKSRFRAGSPDWVWLPNTLVDGFEAGDSPLARLRQIRDRRAIPLLLDCYRHANLAEDGGLPWWIIYRRSRRLKIYTHGHFTVWGFVLEDFILRTHPFATRFLSGDKATVDADYAAFWSTLTALQSAGLLEYVGYVVEGLSEGSQVIHPYALPNEGEPEERAVATAAHAAGRRLITEHNYQLAKQQLGDWPLLCPVRSHVTEVEMVGILRPVHRPQTRKTAAWAANFLHQCDAHRTLFESLRPKSISSVA